MLAVHLRKTKKKHNFMQTPDTSYIYKIDFEKACFQHDMAYGKLKILQTQHNQINF